jgi:hypothetical protein
MGSLDPLDQNQESRIKLGPDQERTFHLRVPLAGAQGSEPTFPQLAHVRMWESPSAAPTECESKEALLRLGEPEPSALVPSPDNALRFPVDGPKTQMLREYLDDFNVPGLRPSWFGFIQKVEVRGDTAVATTSLTRIASESRQIADVCSAMFGWVNSNLGGRAHGVSRVAVHSPEGRTLSARDRTSDTC